MSLSYYRSIVYYCCKGETRYNFEGAQVARPGCDVPAPKANKNGC